MSESAPHDPRQYDDEISLYDLYRTLVEKKVILLSTVIAALLGAIVYLVVTPSTYEAKVRLLLPKANTLTLSTPDHPYTVFEATTIFQGIQAQLRLTEQWWHFVSAHPELFPSIEQNNQAGFQGDIPIKLSTDKNYPVAHIDVTYQDNEAKLAVDILGRYLQFTRDEYVTELVKQVKNRIERQRETLIDEIAMLRQKAKLAREDEIERLNKDIVLARSLGITDNLLMRSGDIVRGGSDIIIIASNETVRGYMRGTKVMAAELEVLQKRKSDDPYIGGLRDKQLELERLNTLQLIPSRLRSYSQDGEIITPKDPIKPRKSMVLILAVLLGGFLGVMMVFLDNAFQKARTQQ